MMNLKKLIGAGAFALMVSGVVCAVEDATVDTKVTTEASATVPAEQQAPVAPVAPAAPEATAPAAMVDGSEDDATLDDFLNKEEASAENK